MNIDFQKNKVSPNVAYNKKATKEQLCSNYVALTWTPKRFNIHNPSMQYHEDRRLLNYISRWCEFTVVCEYNTSGNIHWHGVIRPYESSIWQYFHKVIPTLTRSGFVVMKKNPNDGWYKYMDKDKKLYMDELYRGRWLYGHRNYRKIISTQADGVENEHIIINGLKIFKKHEKLIILQEQQFKKTEREYQEFMKFHQFLL